VPTEAGAEHNTGSRPEFAIRQAGVLKRLERCNYAKVNRAVCIADHALREPPLWLEATDLTGDSEVRLADIKA
jgi:hypothetical protein